MRILATVVAALLLVLPASAQAQTVGTDIGTFSAACDFSHRATADPIVFPGVAVAGHSHDFMGARTTDGFSTGATLRASATSCVRTDSPQPDSARSAYWVPTLYVNDAAVPMTVSTVNYTTGRRFQESILPFPQDFRMIAGSAAGGPQEAGGTRIWFYECKGGTTQNTWPVPTCASTLMLTMRFPDCSNGALDSFDHKSHMAYSQRNAAGVEVCPLAYPYVRPKLALLIRYATAAGPSTRLASGAYNTAHADFFNGWDQARHEQLVRDCLARDEYCGGSDAPVPGK